MKIILAIIITFPFLVFANEHSHHHHHGQDMDMMSEGAMPGESIYNIETKWTDSNNKTVILKNLEGKNIVLSMIYLSCQYTCPLTVSRMKQIEVALSPNKKKETLFVLVSFDPKRDTPAKMNEYKKKHGIDNSRWILMSSTKEDDLRELAGVLGVKYKRMADGEISHSFMITLLDKKGVIKKQLLGTDKNPKDIAKEI